ncbi:MAG TPA: iron-sulfur cluster repair di-iron protein [Balneolaceae bacterium]|nr:iron-sulfur cluster repair di-iron protein [Balneolaceae bacterium]
MHFTDLKTVPVGDIVAKNYHAADVFREYGIDFCCGGHKTLEAVTSKKGISSDDVAQKLVQILDSPATISENYDHWSPNFLIDYIENTHHQFVREKIPQILAYAAKVAKVHGERYPVNLEIYRLFTKLSKELLEHLEDEEENVFPLIKSYVNNGERTVDSETYKAALQKLVEDHEEAGEVMAQISELSNRFTPPADACTTYRILYQNLEGFEQNLHKHVHLENNILFKKAEAVLA